MLVITPARRQFGFGLVELMIGLLVGMIVVAAALSLLSTTMASSNDSIKMLRLDQELRQVMTMITRDLRRATIWDPAVDVARVSLAHPLTVSVVSGSNVTVTSSSGNLDAIGTKAVDGTLVYTIQEEIKVGGVGTGKFESKVYKGLITDYNSGSKSYSVTISTASPTTVVPASSWSILRPKSTITTESGTCILFAYDTDASGTYTNYSASTPSTPNEFFGYRHDRTTNAEAVETKESSAGTCAGGGGNWENLTDEKTIKITNFNVTDNSPAALTSSGFSIDVRVFTISITGQLKSDPSVERTLQETVRVRNDRLS